MSNFTEGHALLIGVGGDLPTTTTDAVEMHKILVDPARCAYPKEQVQLLTGVRAKRADILAGLDRLTQTAAANSTVIVYFSGHGYQVKTIAGRSHFLMPYGYAVDDLAETAISGQEFAQKLQAIPAQKLLMLLDCCHAGGLDPTKAPGATLAKAPLPPEATAVLAQGKGRVLIASSRADELSYAGKPCSAFTLALLEALCGDGASQADGRVRVADLAIYTGGKVPLRTGNRQHPILNYQDADNFVVAFYAGGESQAKGLPSRLQTVEIEPEPGAFTQAILNQQGQTLHGNQQNITGSVTGPVVGGNVGQIGNNTTTTNINTGGGTHVAGDVTISGGDFVGRDRVNVTGFYQPGWPVGTVNQTTGDLTQHFAALEAAIQAAPPQSRQQAQAKIAEIKTEAAKGERADDSTLARLVMEIGALAPNAVEALVNLFAPAALGKIAGAATHFAVNFLRR